MTSAALLLPLALGCHPGGSAPADLVDEVPTDPPAITAVTWDCAVDDADWSFEVQTERWTGGAWLWLATDADTWERHGVLSQEAARDGSTDRLAVTLAIVGDWRDVESGASTRFLCSEEEALAFQVSVYTQDGSEAADCRRWGVEGVLEQIDSVLDCDLPLEEADTGG